jgi:hypothetical protein
VGLALLGTGHDARAQQPERSNICVDVRIGSVQQYDCLNQQLMRQVQQQKPSSEATGTVTAGSPAPAVGSFNQAATQERLGSNFGKSAFPQRPPPPVFAMPLMPQR